FPRRLVEDESSEVIAVGVLLPIQEQVCRRDLQRITDDRRPAMRRGPKAHHLRQKRDGTVIAVFRLVMKRDADRHRESPCGFLGSARRIVNYSASCERGTVNRIGIRQFCSFGSSQSPCVARPILQCGCYFAPTSVCVWLWLCPLDDCWATVSGLKSKYAWKIASPISCVRLTIAVSDSCKSARTMSSIVVDAK